MAGRRRPDLLPADLRHQLLRAVDGIDLADQLLSAAAEMSSDRTGGH
ncbi:hypothetical protein ACIA9I_38085 [Streptomyces anulatus]